MTVRPALLIGLGVAAALLAFSRTKQGATMTAKIVETAASALTPRGIRNNNPGNIERTRDQWRGMSPDQSGDERFVVFDAPVWGLRAMARVLRNYVAEGRTTVRAIIDRWAPPAENDTGSYVNAVAADLNVPPDAPLDVGDPATLAALMAAITHHENGMQPYASSLYAEAIDLERSA